jgi:hypothetical protein
MDATIKSLEERGHSVQLWKRKYHNRVEQGAVIEGQRVRFFMREAVKRTVHKPTAEERARELKWKYSPAPRFDFAPTGQLALEIEAAWSVRYAKHRWRDTTKRRLEEQIGEFIVTLEAIGRVERQRAVEREAEERRQEEARPRARAEEARRLAEAKRVERLADLADQWDSAQRVRAFVEAVAAVASNGDGLDEFLAWARRAAQRLDPLSDPERVIRELREGAKGGATEAGSWPDSAPTDLSPACRQAKIGFVTS